MTKYETDIYIILQEDAFFDPYSGLKNNIKSIYKKWLERKEKIQIGIVEEYKSIIEEYDDKLFGVAYRIKKRSSNGYTGWKIFSILPKFKI